MKSGCGGAPGAVALINGFREALGTAPADNGGWGRLLCWVAPGWVWGAEPSDGASPGTELLVVIEGCCNCDGCWGIDGAGDERLYKERMLFLSTRPVA